MQKHVNLVDFVKSFPTNIFLQNLASIQKTTSPIKFAHLAEKSGKGSISNLSTKVWTLTSERYVCEDESGNEYLSEGAWCRDGVFVKAPGPSAEKSITCYPQGPETYREV